MSFKVTDFGTNRKRIYGFLLVVNTNLPPVLHRFRDTAFYRSVQSRYIWLSLLRLTSLTESFHWDDLRKIFRGCQRMAKVPNDVETLPKILAG